MMIEELYDALLEAGASEAKARAAARAMADFDKRFTVIETQIAGLRAEVDKRFAVVDGTLRLHNWMLGTIIVMLIALLFKVFSR